MLPVFPKKTMKHSYFLVFITPIIMFVLLEAMLMKPEFFWWFLLFILLLIVISITYLASAKKISIASWWNFLILPFIFISSLSFYISLISNRFIIHLLIIVGVIFVFSYLKDSAKFFLGKEGDKNGRLENISSYGNFLSFFFLAASTYGLKSFFGISNLVLVPSFFAGAWLLVHQSVWVNNIKLKEERFFTLIITLILIEIAMAAYFLPFNYNALGLILAICYYMLIGIAKSFFRSSNKWSIRSYLILGFLSILVILLSSQWI